MVCLVVASFWIRFLSRGAAGLLLLLAILAVTFLAYRAHRQSASVAALAIRTPNGIDEGLFVRAGGIDQWVSIRGEDRSNPVMLVLHGGPATSYMSFTTFFQPWERYFTVVQWDRRGVGKTFGRNGRARSGEMTLDRIAEDGAEISEFLRRHLHQDKIILLGHSMGSMIGVAMAARRPDLLYAYVGTEQIVDMARNEEVSYQTILDRSRTAGNASTVKTLERIGAPPYQRALDWGAKQRAAEVADPAYGRTAGQIQRMVLFSPVYSLKDVFDLLAGSMFCISKLYPQWMAFDAHKLGRSFRTPIFIIEGESDVMTPSELAEEWVSAIEAPQKAFVPIQGASHLAFVTAPDTYLTELLGRVRPLASEARSQ
jgi:pimeloyl-ACP methyl ester carboxylesterase